MIELHEFEQALVPLAEVFAPLSDEAAKIYYEHLKSESKTDFMRAVNWLVENHTFKRFPFVSEFKDAIEEVQRLTSGSKKDDRSLPEPTCACEKCNGTGWILVELNDGYSPVARYCACATGKSMHSHHREFFRKRGRDIGPMKDAQGEAAPAQDAVERGKFIERNRDKLFGAIAEKESDT